MRWGWLEAASSQRCLPSQEEKACNRRCGDGTSEKTGSRLRRCPHMRTMWSALLLAALPCVGGWVSNSQASYGATLASIRAEAYGDSMASAYRSLGWLWTLPKDTSDATGLGQSITWAWDPALCGTLGPKFREDFVALSFLSCHSIKASMGRAFDTCASACLRASTPARFSTPCPRTGSSHAFAYSPYSPLSISSLSCVAQVGSKPPRHLFSRRHRDV